MDTAAYSAYLSRFLSSTADVEQQVTLVLALERWLISHGATLETASVGNIRAYLKRLIKQDKNGIDDLLALLYYYEFSPRVDLDIYLNDVIHGGQEFEEIMSRVYQIGGFDVVFKIEDGFSAPPLGTDPALLPGYTAELYRCLSAVLPQEDVRRAICDNLEPIIPFLCSQELQLYRASSTIDEYLLARAKLELLRLRAVRRRDSKWVPIYLSEEYLRRLEQFPEMLSGVRHGNRLFITLRPSEPGNYLKAKTPELRRYYACSDCNIRAAFKKGMPDVPIAWCERCVSRQRLTYEYLLGRPLKAELLESALLGDTSCRIAILLEPDEIES